MLKKALLPEFLYLVTSVQDNYTYQFSKDPICL